MADEAELGFNTVEFFDEQFRLNPGDTYEWEMMEFATAATSGADTDLLSGAASVMQFLKAVIHPEDWESFRLAARKNRAQVKRDLMPIVVQAFTQPAERPTLLPSDSSDGQGSTEQSSADGSSSAVIRRLENQGRPDLALVVLEADEVRSARSA